MTEEQILWPGPSQTQIIANRTNNPHSVGGQHLLFRKVARGYAIISLSLYHLIALSFRRTHPFTVNFIDTIICVLTRLSRTNKCVISELIHPSHQWYKYQVYPPLPSTNAQIMVRTNGLWKENCLYEILTIFFLGLQVVDLISRLIYSELILTREITFT